jgi:iron complex transport system permease protein
MIKTSAEELYASITSSKLIKIIILFIGVIFFFLVNISVGSAWLPLPEVITTIFAPGSAEPSTYAIVWLLRLPVALMAIVVGSSLAIAGVQMQTILDNPLASPFTLGISSAAGFGAAIALILGVAIIPWALQFVVVINAFTISMLTCLLVYLIARKAKMSSETMVLTGIAITFFFGAIMSLLQYFASEQELQAIIFWLFGSLMRTTWPKLAISSAILCLVLFMLSKDLWKLTTLRLGEEKARSLGINTEKLRLRVFILVSLLTSAAVCFVGSIGFIGLTGPHMARMLVGEDQRFFLPAAALGGALLLSVASIAGKLVIPGIILPIGTVTSFIGGPIFVYLIIKRRRSYW